MKTTRSLYQAAFVLLTLPLVASMCGKKNSDPAPQNTHPSTVASVWAWQKLLVSPPVGNIDDILDYYVQINLITNKCIPLLLYEFKSDGTIVPMEQSICQASGLSGLTLGPQTGDKWSVNGSKIIITHADGSKDEATLDLSDKTSGDGSKSKVMTWKRTLDSQTYTWIFERKL
ncbi:hypothetical protein G8759_20720 [Spirosoma aureum]|uniref:Lipocalin family protein n=1 Tax=Spirosoma aureum TaxID=2692134 RepID=A0A6G9AR66_9BACT|nr:hypothetical protein [Spirosoma aureum]QIP14868.1 hypothetical protein G8759_20720 [Spirosoma aureum]